MPLSGRQRRVGGSPLEPSRYCRRRRTCSRPAAPHHGIREAHQRARPHAIPASHTTTVASPATIKTPTVAPYDLRHSFASLLIHEGRNPLLVAAAMGHSSGQLIWSTYGHLFEDARLAPATPMVEAIDAARRELHRSCTEPVERQLRLVFSTSEIPRIPGETGERTTGLEPATSSLGSSRSTS